MERKKAVIWGAGKLGKRVYASLVADFDINVVAYIDSDPTVAGGLLWGVPIISPEQIKKTTFDQVFIAMYDYRQIAQIKVKLNELNISDEQIVDLSTNLFYLDALKTSRSEWLKNCAEWMNKSGMNGNVAECGVFRGDFAKFINKFFPDRKLYLFDTFEGFDTKDMQEEYVKNEQFESSMFDSDAIFKDTSIDFVLKKMSYPDNVIIKKGYFPESAEGIDDSFCFVNLDMDLYVPILNGLRFFWDKMQTGGCILVHDYFRDDLAGVKQAIDDFEQERGIVIPKVPIGDFCSILLIKY